MMRLPLFRYRAARTVAEAADLLASAGPGEAMLLAGGTDLLPNMKRRQQTPGLVIGLRGVGELRRARAGEGGGNAAAPVTAGGQGLSLGSGLTLSEIVRHPAVRQTYGALWQAAFQVATPHLRNMATLGGNLCLDTRCNYYDQNYEWRKAIGFCMKKEGETCWVAPSSRRCLAVSSTDTAPALVSLGARVKLVSAGGERVIPLGDLYRNDGIDYLSKRPDEVLSDVLLEPAGADGGNGSVLRSTYWKLRRRGSFDFPVLSVAAAARLTGDGVVEAARIVLGAVASRPLFCDAASALLAGRKLTDAVIAEAAELAWKVAKPMDNTDLVYHWRKRVTREMATWALREIRGDDMREIRRRIAFKDLAEVV